MSFYVDDIYHDVYDVLHNGTCDYIDDEVHDAIYDYTFDDVVPIVVVEGGVAVDDGADDLSPRGQVTLVPALRAKRI